MQFIVATPSWNELDPLVLSQFQVQIALQPSDGRELDAIAKSFRLTPAQTRFTSGMQRGTGIGKVRGSEHPLLFTYQPFLHAKDSDARVLHDARARTRSFCERHDFAAREGIASNEQPTPSQQSAPSSSPPSRLAPVVEAAKTSSNTSQEDLPSNTSRRVALNKHAAGLLQDAADHLLTPTTAAYDRLGVHYTIGDRAKQLDLNLGLLEAHKVRIGAGRGKTASILRLTPAGWTWLGRKPPKGTRGGDSVAHQYYVLQLLRLIPRSTIETLGADLVIPYNTADHTHLLAALETLGGHAISLNNGDLIAQEVECSMPERTAQRNITRDAGFALTVIAILGKTQQLQRTIGDADRVVIVDVLRLLDALRTTEDR
jgi:hypothetical protein